MPIRFRCAYCNQLLGISRRKANTVVRCPTCSGRVVVPNMESEETEKTTGGPHPIVFERADFDELLDLDSEGGKQQAPASGSADVPVALSSSVEPARRVAQTVAEAASDAELVNVSPAVPLATPSLAVPVGIYLSPAKATLLVAAGLVALALAFAAGLFVGFFLRPAQQTPATLEDERAFSSRTTKCVRSAIPTRTAIPKVAEKPIQRGQIEGRSIDPSQLVLT